MVDDVPVEYYDSVDRKMTLRRHWHKEEGDVADAQMKRMAIADISHSLKNRLQYMTKHFNHSVSKCMATHTHPGKLGWQTYLIRHVKQ